MDKISVNNIYGRIIGFLLGSFPFASYLGVGFLFGWNLEFNITIIIYWCLCLAWLSIFIKFYCLDWDLYVIKEEGFLLKTFEESKRISKKISFEIKTVPLATYYFNVFQIKFDNGEKFYFRYLSKKIRILPLLSFDGVVNEIRLCIEEKLF